MVRKQQSSRAVQRARQRVRQVNASARKAHSIKNRLPTILEQLKRCKYLTSLADQLRTLGTAPQTLYSSDNCKKKSTMHVSHLLVTEFQNLLSMFSFLFHQK